MWFVKVGMADLCKLSIILIEFSKLYPHHMGLANCLVNANCLHCFSVCVDNLRWVVDDKYEHKGNVCITSCGFPSNNLTLFSHSLTLCGFCRNRTL